MGTYLVMKNNFRRSFNHKLLFLISFLLPIMLCFLTGSINFGKTSIRMGLLETETNLSQSENMQNLYQLLDQSRGIKYAFAKESSLHTDLMTGKFHVILDYRDSTSMEDFLLISNQNEKKRIVVERLFRDSFMKRESVNLSELSKKGMTGTERSMAILLSLFMIISSIHAATIIRDRQSGTYNRYQFARESGAGYTLGYIVYDYLITFGQVIICIAVLNLLQQDFMLSIVKGVVMGVAIAMISTIFSMLICLYSKSEMHANITASSLAAVMSLLGGTFVTIESMPGLLRIFSLFSPIRWIVELLRLI